MPNNKKQTNKTSWSFLRDWIFLTLIILTVAFLLPGVTVVSFSAALAAAMVLGILNALFKPFILLLALPINFFTLGLFTLIINAVLIMIVDSLVPGFAVMNFGYALVFGIFISVFTYFVSHFFSTK